MVLLILASFFSVYNSYLCLYFLAKIKIIVTDPIERDSGVSKFTVYTIKGNDRDGPFETYRRYSDFSILKKILVKRWPGCFVPSIPEKKAVVILIKPKIKII